MPVFRFPRIPPRFASGGRLTLPRGADQPVNAPGVPTISPALRPMPPLSPALGVLLAVYRVMDVHSAISGRKQNVESTKGGAALPSHA